MGKRNTKAIQQDLRIFMLIQTYPGIIKHIQKAE